jgi:signal transduction histidine kinase
VFERDAETLQLLRAETDRLRRLVEDLSALSRAESQALRVEPRPVSARQLVRRAAERFADHADRLGLELEVDAAGDLPPVLADPGLLDQVVDNLIDNALRYTPPGGRVRLDARQAGDAVVVSVEDTGIGIADEALPHVFERFYRADSSRSRDSGGSGIGLAIVKHLVERHGGEVGVTSQPGRGSRFSFRIPATVAERGEEPGLVPATPPRPPPP